MQIPANASRAAQTIITAAVALAAIANPPRQKDIAKRDRASPMPAANLLGAASTKVFGVLFQRSTNRLQPESELYLPLPKARTRISAATKAVSGHQPVAAKTDITRNTQNAVSRTALSSISRPDTGHCSGTEGYSAFRIQRTTVAMSTPPGQAMTQRPQPTQPMTGFFSR